MSIVEMNLTCKNIETFLSEVIKKYNEECESAAAELLSWVDSWSIKQGYGRLGFYTVVGIAETCWKVWDEGKVVVNFGELILDIMAVVRRNDDKLLRMGDLELFELLFNGFNN